MSGNISSVSLLFKKLKKLSWFLGSIVLFALVYHYGCEDTDFYSNIKRTDTNLGLRPMQSWFDAVYFSTIVQSTIGYGDISPKKNKAKLLVVFQVMVSFIILLL